MTERIELLIKDNHCEKAVDDFKILTSVPDWLLQNSDLFDQLSIKPEGLTRITSSKFERESLEKMYPYTLKTD